MEALMLDDVRIRDAALDLDGMEDVRMAKVVGYRVIHGNEVSLK